MSFVRLLHVDSTDQSVVICAETSYKLYSPVCVSVRERAGVRKKILCPKLGSAPVNNKVEMRADSD